MRLRQVIGVAALLVSGWLAFFADKTPSGDADLVVPTRSNATTAPARAATAQNEAASRPRAANQGPASPEAVLALTERLAAPKPDAQRPGAQGFGARSWTPPPPPEKPVAPKAPPLPFSFLGKQLQAGVWQVYLAVGEDLRLARVATVIDGQYRVESIVPPLIVFTYLPLNERQTLDIGAP